MGGQHRRARQGCRSRGYSGEWRAVGRAQQAKPYRTRIGKPIDPEMPKAYALVLCPQGHIV
jgi:hypothetical protein